MRLWIWVVVCIGMIGWVTADESEPDYPLVETLRQTAVSVFDPALFAQQRFGVVVDQTFTPSIDHPLGARETFWASNDDGSFLVEAELRAIGEQSLIWVEVGARISDDHLREVAREFDQNIYHQSHALWGDVEALQAPIVILYAHDLGANVLAYFTQRHTYPAQVLAMSNERPMFFINLDGYFEDIDEIGATLGHEYQHMIGFYRNPYQDTWLNEGFSTFSEYYLGYDSPQRYLQPWMLKPNTQLNSFGTVSSRFTHYSASYLFVLYVYQRYGVTGIQTLYHQPARGMEGVAEMLAVIDPETTADQFFADWMIANYLFNHETWGYGEGFPPRPFIRVEALNAPIERTQPQYSAQYFSLFPEGDVMIALTLSESVRLIPIDASSGEKMWYGNRGDISTMTLTRAFDLREVASATLYFDLWHQIEPAWDYAYLLVSDDAGQTWDMVQSAWMSVDDPYGNNYGSGWTGDSAGWRREKVVLDDYIGAEILVRFQYITDDAINDHGIAIDELMVPELDYHADLEADAGGWVADGWVWMDNRLPQKVWVQAIRYDAEQTVIDVERWLYPDDGEIILRDDGRTAQVIVVVSPFAPMTTIPATYRLSVEPLQ